MLNNVILVGRITEDPVIRHLESGQAVCNICLAVTRGYKNSNGEYEVDFINCTLWEATAESLAEYCRKGSIIGIKGRVAAKMVEVVFSKEEPGLKKNLNVLEIIGERVAFINTKRPSLD